MSECVLNASLVRSLTRSAGSIQVRRRLVPLAAYQSGFVWQGGQVGDDDIALLVQPLGRQARPQNCCSQVSGKDRIDPKISDIAVSAHHPQQQGVWVNSDVEGSHVRKPLEGIVWNSRWLSLGRISPCLHLIFGEGLHRLVLRIWCRLAFTGQRLTRKSRSR